MPLNKETKPKPNQVCLLQLVSFSIFLSLSLSYSPSPSLSPSLSLSLSLWLFLPLSFLLPIFSVRIYRSIYLSQSLHIYLSIYLSKSLHILLSASSSLFYPLFHHVYLFTIFTQSASSSSTRKNIISLLPYPILSLLPVLSPIFWNLPR